MDQEAVFSSRRCELFALFNPDGSCSKMSEACFPGMMEQISEPFSGSWPTRGTMQNGQLYAHPTSATPTGESGSSSWHTPQAHDTHQRGIGQNYAANGAGNGCLATDAARWQTPAADSFRSRGGDRKAEMGLDQEARLWRTPGDVTKRGGSQPEAKRALGGHSINLEDQAEHRRDQVIAPDGLQSSPNAPGSRQRLNPTFVETLLGFPVGWTLTAENDSRRLEMQSCPPVADGLESKS